MTNKGDCIAGAAITAIAVFVWTEASKFPEAPSGLGASGFPKFIAICLGFLGIILTITSYLCWKKNPEQEQQVLKRHELLEAGTLAATFWLYVQLVTPFGYVISTILFSFLFMYIFGERKWIRMVLVSVGFSVSSFFLFRNIFYIMLPTGTLF